MGILLWLVLASFCLVAGLVYIMIRWLRRQKRKASEQAAVERAAIERNLEERCRPPIPQKQTQRSEFPRKDAHSSPATRSQRAG